MKKTNLYFFDGTFELCRAYFGAREHLNDEGVDVGAARSLLKNLHRFILSKKEPYAACAFDHVIESFRNKLFDGYKTGEGMDEELLLQFPLAEEASRALGLVTWPMKKFEADDALCAAAAKYTEEKAVNKVYLCTPDKDLAQCVRKQKVLLWDRLREKTYDEAGVVEKFGVPPSAIPDLLALVGDSADGIPGIPKWGMKSAATLLAHYSSLENIPEDPDQWGVKVRGAQGLAENFNEMRKEAGLYKKLATLRTDVPLKEDLEQLRWKGFHRKKMQQLCVKLNDEAFFTKIPESQFQ